jgi:hypothetical protein
MDEHADGSRAAPHRRPPQAARFLANEYDVVTWVLNDQEHVEEYQKPYPPNVVYQAGRELRGDSGKRELAAAIGAGKVDSPDVKPLIPNAREAEAAWYRKTGIHIASAGCRSKARLSAP